MDEQLFSTAQGFLAGRVCMLIVEDDEDFADLLATEYFQSPLFHNHSVDTLAAARERIGSGGPKWHCWIIDLSLKAGQDGFALLPLDPGFPFKIVLSGTRSMENATRALQNGAWGAYDKDPITLFSSDRLFSQVCRAAALSFCLKAHCRNALQTFRLLVNEFVPSTESWAYKACISPRKLQRLVADETDLTPRMFLAFYHAVHYLIHHNAVLLGTGESSTDWYGEKDHSLRHAEFYAQNVRYLLDHGERVASLFL
jgi:hypothetical protein